MDLSLTEDQLGFKALARDFLDKEVLPHRAEWDRRESVDTAIIPRLGEIGFFGLTIPEEYGGLGGDYITYCIGMEELGRADSSVRGIVSVSMGLVGKVILSHGTEEQKHQYLPGIANGTLLGCFGLTEPDNGSDPATLKARARRDGSDYVLNGQKIFITNGTWADVCLVFARTGGDGPKGVSAFLVPTDTPGFEAREIHGKLGLRGQATAEIFLTDVRVPESTRLGEEGEGFRIAMHSLDKGRVSVGAGCTGIIQGCLEEVVKYTTERKQFGRPIASFQGVALRAADAYIDLEAMRSTLLQAAWRVAEDLPARPEVAAAKWWACRGGQRVVHTAQHLHGGIGADVDYPIHRFFLWSKQLDVTLGGASRQLARLGAMLVARPAAEA
jgi:alkylation response protein AidB-like acyl-CoA dehydrogenase